MVFPKLFLENALAARPWNCEAVLEQLLHKVARCIPVISLRYIGKCDVCVLKRSDGLFQNVSSVHNIQKIRIYLSIMTWKDWLIDVMKVLWASLLRD